MTDRRQFATNALAFVRVHRDEPLFASSLEALLRSECAIMLEAAEEISRGTLSDTDLRDLFVGVPSGCGVYVPPPGFLEQMLPDAILCEVITERVLSGWDRSEALRFIAAHMAQGRISPDAVRQLLIRAAGAHLADMAMPPSSIGKLVTAGAYNWAMRYADRFGRKQTSLTVLRSPGFSCEEAQGFKGVVCPLTFPSTGSVTLHELLAEFAYHARPPWIYAGPHRYTLDTTERFVLDPRESGIEAGWHAVGVPCGAENYERFFGASSEEQEAAVAEIYPGWRIASAVEILTWAILHLRLNGELPVADVFLRARKVEGTNFTWMVGFGDDGRSLSLRTCVGWESGSNLGVAISRVPSST